MFLGGLSEFPFCEGLLSADLILYVHSAYRGTSAGPRLVKEYIAWARSRGVDSIGIANSTEIDTERVALFYERMGFEKIGYVFKYKEGC